MKKIIILSTFLATANFCISQDFEELYNRVSKFDSFEQFDSVDEEMIPVMNHILSVPFPKSKPDKKTYFALKSMLAWMNNTTSYKILIFGKIVEGTKGDKLMQNMFMAAMGKFLLEERYVNGRHVFPEKEPNVKFMDLPEVRETLLESTKIFLDYLENTSQVKPNKEFKKAIKARNSGNLESYMFN